MGDWFAAAQRDFDTAVPRYLEADTRPCDECGVPIEDHCVECDECHCTCDELEEED